MADREKVYRMFGPKLIEGVVETMLAEINELRTRSGLAAKTTNDILTSIDTKTKAAIDYTWAKKPGKPTPS